MKPLKNFSTRNTLRFFDQRDYPEGLGIVMEKIVKYFILGGLYGAEINKI